jgi:hypothetical protein
MTKLKISICESLILLLHENSKIGVNFIFFLKAERLKLGLFGKHILKLS